LLGFFLINYFPPRTVAFFFFRSLSSVIEVASTLQKDDPRFLITEGDRFEGATEQPKQPFFLQVDNLNPISYSAF
jgi:hypothetical protein